MLKLLFIIPSLDSGGAEKQLALLARGLHARGHTVLVCTLAGCGPHADELRQAGVAVEVLGAGSRLDPRPLWRLQRRLRAFAPDLVHTCRPGGNLIGRWQALRHANAPVVATAHLPEDAPSFWQRFLQRRLHRRTARWICTSQALAAKWQAAGVAPEKLAVIYSAATADRPSGDLTRLRHGLRLPEHAHLVACVGRLVSRKGPRDAIWAVDILRFLYEDLYLLIAGDGPLRGRLEQFARDMRVLDRVRFLGQRDDVPDLLRLADVVWAPSHVDDIPNAMLEAMALGKPVVASRLPALAEAIVDGESGFLTPPGDKAALSRQTRLLIDDPALRQRLGDAARARAAEAFGLDRFVSAHEEVYRQVIAERAAPQRK